MKSAITAALAALAVLLSVSAFSAENPVMRGPEGYFVFFLADALYFFCAIAAFILLRKAARLGKLGKKDNAALTATLALATLALVLVTIATIATFALVLATIAIFTSFFVALDGTSSYRAAQVLVGISMACMAVATYQAVVL
jgi:hypothetical protein